MQGFRFRSGSGGRRRAADGFLLQAFEHAGGEIIFQLPNKLQGYLLVNSKDERIAAGPIEIVSDALQTSGTATIDGLALACKL